MGIPGPLYTWELGQPRTETTAEKIFDEATAISGSNPTRAAKFFDLANEPAPLWVAEDYGSAHGPSGIDTVLDACTVSNTVPQFTMYSIPGRDGGSFSAGGSDTHAEYVTFVQACAAAVAGRPCIWVIEPDAIPKMYAMSGGINGSAANQRKASIEACVTALRAQGSNVKIYLNVGNSNFRSASEIAGLIADCGIADADGISLNVAQTQLFHDEYDYYLDVKALEPDVDGCVIATGLNGRGPYSSHVGDRSDVQYINPPTYGYLDGTNGRPNRPTEGVSIGPRPTTKMDMTDYPGLHAILWTKFPGGSDGNNPTVGDVPDKPPSDAPDPGDLYPDYLERAYDAAAGLDFSEFEPFLLDEGEPGDPVLVAWNGIDTLMYGDDDRARTSWTGLEVLSPLEERARAAWQGIDALMYGDTNRARSSWFAIDLLFAEETFLFEGVDLPVSMEVFESQDGGSLTGEFSIGDIKTGGWIWDRRRLEDSRWNYAQYLDTLGGHSVGLKDGTQKSWWQSGTNIGCEYLGCINKYIEDRSTWTPTTSIGMYSLQFEGRLLYSDYSYTSSFHPEVLHTGVMKHELHPDAVWTSIQVALWRRDDVFTIRKHWDFKYVDLEFTGELDESSNSRLDTTDGSGTIIVDNLASRKKEFLIQDGRVLLNGIHVVDNTFLPSSEYPIPPATDTQNYIESGGLGQEDGRAVLLTYLPIQPNTVRVWIDEGLGTLTEWTEVPHLEYAEPDEQVFSVDTDLGIINMGGYQAPDLILLGDLNQFDTEVAIYPEQTDINEYPESGVIVIGSEEILYQERTNKRFSNCIRGYNGTTVTGHTDGSVIAHRRMGLGTTGSIYVEYVAVPRIDYEVTSHEVRTANTSRSWLDVKPLSNVETNNIVQIHPGDISLDSILLETDSQLIGGNLYGPVFYGSDISRMTATGFDPHGNPIPDVELTIAVIEGTGFLNGRLSEFTDLSNTLGEVYADYNHPMDRDEFEFSVDSVVHNGGNTIMTVPELVEGTSVNDVWVFQVLKFDKIVGTVGLPLEITATGAATEPYGGLYLDLDGLISQDFRDGLLHVTIAGTKYYRTITWLENLLDVDDQLFTRIYIDSSIPGVLTGATAYLLEPQAIEWNPDLLNGTRYILYEYSNDVLHPLTGEIGAYAPIHPDSIDTTTGEITFLNRTLPLPDPDDLENNLGAYVIVAPGEVSLQARGRDPMTGQIVESNIIRLTLRLANFFVGVDSTGVLPVPRGFNFGIQESNVGTGLGGANFYSINPAASLISQFCLVIEL